MNDPRRARCTPDRGEMTLDGAPYAPRAPLDARRAGVAMVHQELLALPAPDRRRERRARRRAVAARLLRRACEHAPRARCAARRDAASGDPSRQARVSDLVARGAAARRDRARARARDARVLVSRRADEQPPGADVERLFALIRRARGARARDPLRLALPRGGAPDRRPLHGAPRRPQRRRRRHRRRDDRLSSSPDGRPPASKDCFRARIRSARRGRALGARARARRRGCARRASSCVAARCSASPASSARAAPSSSARSSGSTRRRPARSNCSAASVPRAGRRRSGSRRASASERGSQGRGARARRSRSPTTSASTRPTRSRAGGCLDLTRQAERTRHWIRELRIRARSPEQPVSRALRRQPAEGRARAAAAPRRRRAPARRADARHRRRQQGRIYELIAQQAAAARRS